MQRVLFSRLDWPLHDTEASRQIEHAALEVEGPHVLMQRAGLAVASLARAVYPHARTAWVACGPGNNGGDGFEAAIHLRAAGLRVVLAQAGDVSRRSLDAQKSFQRAQAAGLQIATEEFPNTEEAPDFAIDALLGLGTTRAPDAGLANLVDQLNSSGAPILAVDLPSGLNADTGQPLGKRCVVASHTLSLLTLKPGLFTGSGRDLAGDVWIDTLGQRVDPAPSAWLNLRRYGSARRQHAQHKGSFGDVVVMGGAAGMIGAALLAARAAHAAGAGRVYVELLDPRAPTVNPSRPELMFRPLSTSPNGHDFDAATVVCGCGGGDAVRNVLPRVLSSTARLVLDADALNAISADISLQQLLVARSSRQLPTVLTPHPLEAARLLHQDTAKAVQADRLNSAKQLADRFRCVVVLKGSGTVLAAPGMTPWINATGNASLATAGTGDVLAGWLGGSWSASSADAIDAARHAVWLHGAAADQHACGPLRAADLIDAMIAAAQLD